MSSVDITVMIILIFVMLVIVKKFNVLKTISQGGKIEKDFKGCYIISYPKKAELHNKGEIFDINLEEFFELNPKLKGKIPVEKREGLKSTDEIDVKIELKERRKIKQKYSKLTKQKEKKKREDV